MCRKAARQGRSRKVLPWAPGLSATITLTYPSHRGVAAVGPLRKDYRVDRAVRLARASDAHGVGLVQARAWQSRYAGTLPKGVLAELEPADLADRWRAATSSPPSPRHRVLVALEHDRVVGFAATAPSEDPDLEPMLDGELVMLLVDPDATGRGHGSRLLAAAAEHLRGDGFRHAVSWVLATDDAWRAFLDGAGWAPDGAHRELDTGADDAAVLRQLRLHTALEEDR